jgi:hypothetical protein
MTRRLVQFAVAAAAASILLAGGQLASAAGGKDSFHVSLSGTATATSQSTILWAGSGTATRMGHVTNQGNVVLLGPDSSCPNGIANVNTETLTTSDGDALTISSTDVACPVGPGQFHGTGQWHVTGGTGRFSGATGSGSADGGADFNAGTFTLTLTGTLTRPGE